MPVRIITKTNCIIFTALLFIIGYLNQGNIIKKHPTLFLITNKSTKNLVNLNHTIPQNKHTLLSTFAHQRKRIREFPIHVSTKFLSPNTFQFEYQYGKSKSTPIILNKMSTQMLSDLNYLIKNTPSKEPNLREFPQLVTAISWNHATELIWNFDKMVKFITSEAFLYYYSPVQEIIVYILEHTINSVFNNHIEKLLNQLVIDTGVENHYMPRITVRNYNFDAYPPHVGVLDNFSWKVVLQVNMLREFGNVWYFDSSVAVPVNDEVQGGSLKLGPLSRASQCGNVYRGHVY